MVFGLAPVVPEIPAAVLFAVSAVAFLSFFILYMLRFGARAVITGLLGGLASLLPTIFGLRHVVESGVDSVAKAVDDVLGEWASKAQGVGVATFNDAWKLTKWVGKAMADLAAETARAFHLVVTSTIPSAVRSASGFLQSQLAAALLRLHHLEQTVVAGLRADIASIEASVKRDARTAETAIHAAEHAITVTVPDAIGSAVADVRGWTSKQIRRLSRRLTAVEKAVGLTALSGVVVAVIARQIPWVRCQNVGKVGKALCGTSTSSLDRMLEDALLGATLIVATIDLVELSREMQAVVADTATVTRVLLGVAPASDLEHLSL